MAEYVMVSHLLVVEVVNKWKILDQSGLRIEAHLKIYLGDNS